MTSARRHHKGERPLRCDCPANESCAAPQFLRPGLSTASSCKAAWRCQACRSPDSRRILAGTALCHPAEKLSKFHWADPGRKDLEPKRRIDAPLCWCKGG